MTQALLGRSAAELQDWAVAQGQKPFRGRQLHDWIYAKGARSLADITVLPKTWRASLVEAGIDVGRLKEVHRSVATDATTKLLLSTEDGETIETVGIPTDQRLTVCVSSQVGCPHGLPLLRHRQRGAAAFTSDPRNRGSGAECA